MVWPPLHVSMWSLGVFQSDNSASSRPRSSVLQRSTEVLHHAGCSPHFNRWRREEPQLDPVRTFVTGQKHPFSHTLVIDWSADLMDSKSVNCKINIITEVWKRITAATEALKFFMFIDQMKVIRCVCGIQVMNESWKLSLLLFSNICLIINSVISVCCHTFTFDLQDFYLLPHIWGLNHEAALTESGSLWVIWFHWV